MSRLLRFWLPALWLLACTPPAPHLILHTDTPQPGAVVVLDRAQLAEAGLAVPAGSRLLLKGPDGNLLPVQADDLDADGEWDALALQVDLPGGELVLEPVIDPYALKVDFPARTNVRLGYSPQQNRVYEDLREGDRHPGNTPQIQPPFYQMEGPAWENDVVAFRSYFDRRNGKDIFGKLVPDMVLDTVGTGGNYHALDPSWGMDVLKVGNSLGAGALALMVGDSLVRLGETQAHHFQLLAEGPVRSIFELTYAGWQVEGRPLALEERIEIRAGEPGFRSEVRLSGFSGTAELVSGIVNLHSDTVLAIAPQGAWAGIATHARQSENNDYLGMGLLVENLARTGAAPEAAPAAAEGVDPAVTQTYWASARVEPGQAAHFFFLAAWEATDPQWADQAAFEALVRQQAASLGQVVDWRVE